MKTNVDLYSQEYALPGARNVWNSETFLTFSQAHCEQKFVIFSFDVKSDGGHNGSQNNIHIHDSLV